MSGQELPLLPLMAGRVGMAEVQGAQGWAANPTGGEGVGRAALPQNPGADQGGGYSDCLM